jgi:hypothetical protein
LICSEIKVFYARFLDMYSSLRFAYTPPAERATNTWLARSTPFSRLLCVKEGAKKWHTPWHGVCLVFPENDSAKNTQLHEMQQDVPINQIGIFFV